MQPQLTDRRIRDCGDGKAMLLRMSDATPTHSFTPEEEARIWRAHRLLLAWEESTPTTLDGVHLQLACDVDKSIWHPLSPLGLYGHRAALYGPEIIFPWTPPEIRELLAQHTEVVEVGEGSTVLIGFVTSAPLKSAFADFSDAEQREGKRAHLFVLQPDGQVHTVKRPLILLTQSATEALIGIGDYSAAYRGLLARLEERTGISDLETFIDEPVETWPKPRGDLPATYANALLALIQANRSCDHEPYVAFGYLMAKAEAEAQLLEPATRGRQAVAFQARAADGRRLKSRQATEKLRIIARRIIDEDGEISLSRCARTVEDAVADDPTWTFKSDAKWITRHIRELFERRGKGLEYRPKRPLEGGTTAG